MLEDIKWLKDLSQANIDHVEAKLSQRFKKKFFIDLTENNNLYFTHNFKSSFTTILS